MTHQSQKEICNIIVDTIEEICKIKIDNFDRNLLGNSYPIPVAEFLYVFVELEKKLNIPVAKILEYNSYEVFTVNRLSEEILNYHAESGRQ
jgi:DNA-dependent RNA polymerase auxiliary subunit epsilon